jgi:hypothetical protein
MDFDSVVFSGLLALLRPLLWYFAVHFGYINGAVPIAEEVFAEIIGHFPEEIFLHIGIAMALTR